jgi:hypothetical protein
MDLVHLMLIIRKHWTWNLVALLSDVDSRMLVMLVINTVLCTSSAHRRWMPLLLQSIASLRKDLSK